MEWAVNDFSNPKSKTKSNERAVLMAKVHHWCKTDHLLNLWTKIIIHSISYPKLCSTLGMSHVYNFANVCFLQDGVNICWEVIFAHFVEWIVPVFRVVDCQVHMSVGVSSPSVVAEPDVVTLLSKSTWDWFCLCVEEPSSSDIDETVLHEHDLSFPCFFVD